MSALMVGADVHGPIRHVRFWPRMCENPKSRSATRMIFLCSTSKLNGLAMRARQTVLNN
jgi:hypothetical protein